MTSVSSESRSVTAGVADAVYQELIHLLYKQAPAAFFAGVAAACGVLMALWGWIRTPVFLAPLLVV